MKKNLLFIAVLAIGLMFTNEMSAQEFASLDVSPMDAASYPASYSRSLRACHRVRRAMSTWAMP